MAKKTPKIVPVPIKKDTRDAIAFFNDKKKAVDLIKPDGNKKFKLSGYTNTMNDKFFNWLETDGGKQIALTLTVAAISAVVYWLIKQ